MRLDRKERLEAFAGFGLNGYRSFGSSGELQRIGPISDVHLLVGKNNAGKSNVLRFVSEVLPKLGKSNRNKNQSTFRVPSSDLHSDWPPDQHINYSLGVRVTGAVNDMLFGASGSPALRELLESSVFMPNQDEIIWIDFDLPTETSSSASGGHGLGGAIAAQIINDGKEELIFAALSELGIPKVSDNPAASTSVLLSAVDFTRFIPSIAMVNAKRHISNASRPDLGSGKGLITKLAELQQPEEKNYRESLGRFHAFTNFVRAVLEDYELTISIPDKKDTILLVGELGIRSIENLGDGISELIVLAANATVQENKLICIEEPETHLHPGLQRLLMQYLATQTDNKYLISTHSASLLNMENSSVSHIYLRKGASRIKETISREDLASAVFDLGNRASDLIQTNYIVWVEGPSDRLYIRKWLSIHDSEIIENVHYVIMFYGGNLLNHLSADSGHSSDVDDFIQLLEINRNFSIVIDSDITKEGGKISTTKKRIVAEAKRSNAHAWVTDEYTIENYIERKLLRDALAAAHPELSIGFQVSDDMYRSPLSGKESEGRRSFSKVKVARETVARMNEVPERAAKEISEIARRVREVNGLKHKVP